MFLRVVKHFFSPTFDNVFLICLMKELQKYVRNLIPTMAFIGQIKTGHKTAARLAGLAVLSCR